MSGDSPDSIKLPFMTAMLLTKSLVPPLDPLGICVTSPAKRYFYCMHLGKSYLSKNQAPGHCELIICGRPEIIPGPPGCKLNMRLLRKLFPKNKVGPLLGPLLDLPVGKSGLCYTNDTGDAGRIP